MRSDDFNLAILGWYETHRRELPWRAEGDAYPVLVSEVMLQQTRVAAVVPFYHRWMRRFPSAEHVAEADDDALLAAWEGLGYYRRCLHLRESCRLLVREGRPKGREGWAILPGIGPYTAAAMASRMDHEPVAAIDGNVERVFSRVASSLQTGEPLRRSAQHWADQRIDRIRPGDWNQAIMELGATICTPKGPKCQSCPIASFCSAHRSRREIDFPKRVPKPPLIDHPIRCVVPVWNREVGLVKEQHGPWWVGMYVFPEELVCDGVAIALPDVRQTVTRHRVLLQSTAMVLDRRPSDNLRWTRFADADALPIPRPHRRVLQHVFDALKS